MNPYDVMQDVSANGDTLMRQAPMTVSVYFDAIVERVDARFGEGYSKQHPSFIASLVASAAQDFHTANIRIAAQDIRDALRALIEAHTVQ